MTEPQAEALASILAGQAWQSGGGIWLVTLTNESDRFVVFSGDCIAEYETEDAFNDGANPAKRIDLPEGNQRWVIQDADGNVIYQHDHLELGWTDQHEAEHQTRYLQTRDGGHFLYSLRVEGDAHGEAAGLWHDRSTRALNSSATTCACFSSSLTFSQSDQ